MSQRLTTIDWGSTPPATHAKTNNVLARLGDPRSEVVPRTLENLEPVVRAVANGLGKVYKVDNPKHLCNHVSAMATTLEKKGGKMKLPSHEQSVVDEFTSVIRKHQGQAPTTLARLVGVAFELTLGAGESREDKLARAHLRGLGARQQLAEAEGGSSSSEEVARMLQISKTAVLKRLAAGRLLAWREERLQAARFPRWQFDEHGQVLDGLEEVLEVLNQDERIGAWGKILFFLQEKASLHGRRPLDMVREGKLKEVHLAALAYAE